ncbi:MAG TPA: DUF6084 family protein [Nocardioidaceae bacterium]|nr:DUF6084 family protein [Nocardioidaceae bacterium]
MSDYEFSVLDIAADQYAAAPQLVARVRIEEHTGRVVHAVALRAQARIEPQRRAYSEADETGLRALFGERERWAQTLKPFLWMQCNTTVQGFTGSTEVGIALPCTYDFDVVGSRYLHAVGDGGVPVTLLFSGTVFIRGVSGFEVEQVPWDCEARYDLPVQVWRDMIAAFYPGTGWLRTDHDTIAALADYRARHGLISWEETFARLLAGSDHPAVSP